MKNLRKAMLAQAFCLLCGFHAEAQPAPAAVPTPSYKSAHYEIQGMGADSAFTDEAGIEVLGRELDLRFEYYNRFFRFDPQSLTGLLKVKVFGDDASYDAYVMSRLGALQEGSVYLHYSRAEKRELCIFPGSPEAAGTLPHQSFYQFLRAFVPNPPPWIREGFAIYLGKLTFDPRGNGQNGVLQYEENLAWLERAKSLAKSGPSLQSVLETGAVPQGDVKQAGDFQAVSWALVSFFLNSANKDYQRTLSESFMVLSPTATSEENAREVLKRISQWTDPAVMERDYFAYLDSRKTFAELMDEGRKAYDAADLETAGKRFSEAMDLRPSHYAPLYYLGLLAFDEQNYSLAEDYYKKALANGADEGTIAYALGVNAAAAGNNSEAADYLNKAAAVSPERYKAKAAEILANLSK